MRNRQQAARYAHSMRLVLGVTPECFYRGSSSESVCIPAYSMRNDGLGIGILLNAATCGDRPTDIEL